MAEASAQTVSNVSIAPQPTNFNLGQALRYGFSLSRGDYIVTLDADLSYSSDHVGRLLDTLTTTEAKIVIASPYTDGGEATNVPGMRLAASRAANRLLSMTAKGDLTAVTDMVRGYDTVFLRRLYLKAMDVETNAEIIYKAQLMRARITEIPAHLKWTRDGEEGNTPKFRPSRSIAGFAFVSFLFRPYADFLIPGTIAAVIAIGFWVGVLVLSFGDGIPSDTAVMASMFTILAAILMGMGVLSAQAIRHFEELFHLGTSTLRSQREQIRS